MVFRQLTKEESKEKIKELVDEYTTKIKDREHSLDERNTERFIERILQILNWDIDNFDQVIRRDSVKVEDRTKIPDYVLYINGEKKAVVEAKAFSESLDNPKYIKQALEYGYYKQVRVCILTNGKEIRIYDPFILSKSSEGKLLFSVHINQYENLFDQRLWFLSYNEIKENTILAKFASKGEVKKPVSEEVIDNIIKGRKFLIDSILNLNKIDDFKIAREHAHKIINRFLFIRVAEDRSFFKEFDHGRILEDRVNIFKKRISQKIKPLMNEIKELFMEINEVYNGELFKPHPCEELKIDSESLEKVIYLMYYIKHENGEEDQVDFSKLDADVLGSIYEKFLGTIIHETKSGKLIERVDNGVRKEMGQYYTPQFIVDFIVQNTINSYLEENPDKLFSIKIIDPACGSGAFLIKAFDSMYNKYRDFNKQEESKRKTNNLSGFIDDKSVARINEVILHKHIHGVDLDSEAVELAKINLWLRTIQEEMKLNELNKNIKQGNSLISDKTIDSKSAFDWDKEFQYKFDIVIGNPPWISIKGKHKSIDISEEELNYYFKTYNCDTYMPNMYEIFIRKGLRLLNENGFFSFIVPDRLCANQQFIELRKDLLENYTIKKLWFKVKFPEIIADTVVFVIQNKKPSHNLIEIRENNKEMYEIPQDTYLNSGDFSWFYVKKDLFDIFNRIRKQKGIIQLFEFSNIKTTSGCGAKSHLISDEKTNERQIQILKGESINKYVTLKKLWFNFEKRNLSGRTTNQEILGKKYKVLLRKTGIDLIATYDDSGIFPEQSLYFVYTEEDKNKEDLIFLTGLLNSKLMNVYYRNFAITNRDATPQLKKVDFDKFPIITPSPEIKEKINLVVIELMKLQKPYLSISSKLANSDSSKKGYYDLVEEKTKLKAEIDKFELKLNEIIYNLYKVSDEEKKIIEDSLK
ncbi:MAG: TaqI-like C-terminal specificity domain-containing protein [Candidatus Woesearchaeota archaeon]